jgi:heme oxygenase (biliverdin-producing, ferredoxin)
MSETTAPATFAERLRDATATAHTAAERTSYVKHLFRGMLPREAYVAFIRALHPVYVALEAGLAQNKEDKVVAMVYDPALNRVASLEQDLQFFAGADWAKIPVVKSATDYAAHLAGLARTNPPGLVAHAYVRYLGDLSGGQMMGRGVAKTYDVGEAGTNFYNFREVSDVNGRKNTYRAALSALPLDAKGQDEIVAEAITGFEYARLMFEDLDKAYPTS